MGHSKDLADKPVIAFRTYSNAELRREVSIDAIVAISETLNIETDNIIDRDSVDALTEGPFGFQ